MNHERSDLINRRLLRHIRAVDAGAEDIPSGSELAAELGITRNVVHKRLERLRKRGKKLPDPKCDCDEVGPCVRHFVPPPEGV